MLEGASESHCDSVYPLKCLTACFNGLVFSVENATVTYHLQFGVPAEDDGFMDYMMSEELVLGIIRQNFHDKNVSSCESLGLDPESLLLYGKLRKQRSGTQNDE